jgi:hypothetical protein
LRCCCRCWSCRRGTRYAGGRHDVAAVWGRERIVEVNRSAPAAAERGGMAVGGRMGVCSSAVVGVEMEMRVAENMSYVSRF